MITNLFKRDRSDIRHIGDGLFERKVHGFTVRSAHYNSLKNTCDKIFFKGIYVFDTAERSPFIIDGGANIGLASLFWKFRYPDAKILAFEPSRDVCQMLSANLKLNGITDVTVLPFALYHSKTELSFGTNEALSGSLILEKQLPITYKVNTAILSDYVTKRVDLLKLDIEGVEFEVLAEVSHKLHLIDRLFIEYHSFEHSPQKLSELLGMLQNAGFRYHLTSEYVLDAPFKGFKKSLGQDLQVNIWAVNIRHTNGRD